MRPCGQGGQGSVADMSMAAGAAQEAKQQQRALGCVQAHVQGILHVSVYLRVWGSVGQRGAAVRRSLPQQSTPPVRGAPHPSSLPPTQSAGFILCRLRMLGSSISSCASPPRTLASASPLRRPAWGRFRVQGGQAGVGGGGGGLRVAKPTRGKHTWSGHVSSVSLRVYVASRAWVCGRGVFGRGGGWWWWCALPAARTPGGGRAGWEARGIGRAASGVPRHHHVPSARGREWPPVICARGPLPATAAREVAGVTSHFSPQRLVLLPLSCPLRPWHSNASHVDDLLNVLHLAATLVLRERDRGRPVDRVQLRHAEGLLVALLH